MKPWAYLEREPASDAPMSDNPSGLYCEACRSYGAAHCSEPEYCGGMRRMKPQPASRQALSESQDERAR
jgi:hypothetical protein